MSLHSDTLFWFRANQSLLFLLNAACLAEKQQIPILYSLVWPDRGSNPWSTAHEASTLTITPPMLFLTSDCNVNYRNFKDTFKYNNWLDQCDLKKLKGILFKFNKWFDQCKRKKTKTYFQVQCERNQRNQRNQRNLKEYFQIHKLSWTIWTLNSWKHSLKYCNWFVQCETKEAKKHTFQYN